MTLGATDLTDGCIEGGKQVALWLAVAVTLLDDRPRRRRSDRDYDDRDDRGYDRDDRPRRRSDRDDRDYDRDDRRGGRSDDRRGGCRGGYDRNPRYATDDNYDDYRSEREERTERPRRRVRRDFDPFED